MRNANKVIHLGIKISHAAMVREVESDPESVSGYSGTYINIPYPNP